MKITYSIIIASLFFLMSPFLKAQTEDYQPAHEGWHVLLEDAHRESQQTGKPIMAFFTGSDWCRPCMRFSAAVFDHEDFKQWASDKVVLFELDFPRRRSVPEEIQQQNGMLQQTLGVRGYPTVFVFNLVANRESGQTEIQTLGSTNFVPTFEEFVERVENMLP
ncbi:MAG: thioredoxin family protein [Saprospirales bacterium]|jgi:thioredoxin-related protein|nr:MAG: thioredoxin family protein [Saprospirales bacterium]